MAAPKDSVHSQQPNVNGLALHVEGLTFVVRDDEEPRIRDLDLAERLGFERPRKIRDLIRRYRADGNLSDSDICPTMGRTRLDGRGRPSTEFWLSEAAAMFIAAKSETPGGNAALRAMVSLWITVRRQLVTLRQPSIDAILDRVAAMERQLAEARHVDSRGIVYNDRRACDELRNLIYQAAHACGVSFRAIEGVIREDHDIPGYLSLPLRDLPAVRDKLMRFIGGTLTFICGRQRRRAARPRLSRVRKPRRNKQQLSLIPGGKRTG